MMAEQHDRITQMKALRTEGKTLQQIGDLFGVSRQYVHQLISGRTKEQLRQANKSYNKNHSQSSVAYQREYRATHREQMNAYHRKYYHAKKNGDGAGKVHAVDRRTVESSP